MSFALFDESLDGSSFRGLKQWLSGDAIIIHDGCSVILLDVLDPCLGVGESISSMLGVMPVEAADFIGSFEIASPLQVLLDRVRACSMGFLAHHGFLAYDWKFTLHCSEKSLRLF